VAQTYAETMSEVRNAAVKLQRAVANGGVDPVSGYRDKDIAAYLRAADETVRAEADAALYQCGYSID
jgi:biotin carboxylase